VSCGYTLFVFVVLFFKQKTAYEIPKRDWSSDVCSSDLGALSGRMGDGYLLPTTPEVSFVGEAR